MDMVLNPKKAMRRRDLIKCVAGAVVAWPLPARGQRRPRVEVLTLASSQEKTLLIAAFVDSLRKLGYFEGENVDLDYRYAEATSNG